MRQKRIFLWAAFITLCLTHLSAQSIETANTHYNEFVKMYSASGESLNAYNRLYGSFEQYWKVLHQTQQGSSTYAQAKVGLKNVFPYLNSGAYFYTGQNNQARTEQFVEAYLDISMHEAMRGENLQVGNDYATFSWMAASTNYNQRNYAKAITYLQAYINSGQAEKRQEAYNFMAKAYIYLNDNARAKYILQQGLALYPDNLSMLSSIINMLGESKDDDAALQKYVTQALRQKPNDEGLLHIQAQLYERTHNYEQAIIYYTKLKAFKPNNLEIARHLARCNYNIGVLYARKSEQAEKKNLAKQYRQQALSSFTAASQTLNEVVYSDPYALDYLYALAYAYAYLEDQTKLQSVNEKLIALNHSSINNTKLVSFDEISPASDGPGPILPPPPQAPDPEPEIYQVDTDIPVNPTKNSNTFAIIIANEDYDMVAKVPNAKNDGNVFGEYCNKVLGIPKINIRKHLNVTLGKLVNAIEDMKGIVRAKHGQCNIIFYYAGHGVPDENEKTAYILPVDANGKQMITCYALNKLYAEMSEMGANCTTVFLDACFSGATRDDSMIASARGVAIDVEPEDDIEGKIVVFSAAQGNQTALAYDRAKHGMFTYYLLRKLKETKGNVTLSELGTYIKDQVSINARLVNHKEQTPTVIAGYAFGNDWGKVRLNK